MNVFFVIFLHPGKVMLRNYLALHRKIEFKEFSRDMKKVVVILSLLFMMASCTSSKTDDRGGGQQYVTDSRVLEELQGVWLDDNTEAPLFKIAGDSIYYSGQHSTPQQFALIHDTLIVYGGAQTVYYVVRRRTEHTIHFVTPQGDQVSLHKSDVDSVYVEAKPEPRQSTEVLQKDSVIVFNGERYRGYAYINPTGIKVIRPGISEEGLSVDNVFYDNVIHICVYQGTRRLYSKDVKRSMFTGLVPEDFLNNAILADMDFIGVDEHGYVFEATLCMPDGPTCYNIHLIANKEGNLEFELCQ